MHADTMYHRMLEQEAATETAKSEGEPIPTFLYLLSKNSGTPSNIGSDTPQAATTQASGFYPSLQGQIKKSLEDLDDRDRDIRKIGHCRRNQGWRTGRWEFRIYILEAGGQRRQRRGTTCQLGFLVAQNDSIGTLLAYMDIASRGSASQIEISSSMSMP